MKRLISAALTALLASPLAAAPAGAQAAPAPDPVRAVRSLLARNATVKITEIGTVNTAYTWNAPSQEADVFRYNGGYLVRHKGWARLSPAGVAASRMTRKLEYTSGRSSIQARADQGSAWAADMLAQRGIHQAVSVKGALYGSGVLYGSTLPQGKTWARLGAASGGAAAYGDQIVNVFEPGTLKALLARTSRRGPRSTVYDAYGTKRPMLDSYSGTITFAQLYAVSPTFRETLGGRLWSGYRDLTVNWQVTIDEQGLPVMVIASWEPGDRGPVRRATVSTTYGYKSRVSITAPPAARTARPARQPKGDDIMDAFASPQA